MLDKIAILWIKGYQKYISPYKGYKCAYSYYTKGCSCSEYAKKSIIHYGIIKSIPLIDLRLKECRAVYFENKEKKKNSEVDACNEIAGVCACL